MREPKKSQFLFTTGNVIYVVSKNDYWYISQEQVRLYLRVKFSWKHIKYKRGGTCGDLHIYILLFLVRVKKSAELYPKRLDSCYPQLSILTKPPTLFDLVK